MSSIITTWRDVASAGRTAGPTALVLSFTRAPVVVTVGALEGLDHDAGDPDPAITEEVGHGVTISPPLTRRADLA